MPNQYGLTDQEYGQLDFYASLAGMDVDSYLISMGESQAAEQAQNAETMRLTGFPTNNRTQAAQLQDYVTGRAGANDPLLAGLQAQTAQSFGSQNALLGQSQQLGQNSINQASQLGAYNQQLAAAGWQGAGQANAANQQTLGTYTTAMQNAANWDMANYGQLQSGLSQSNATAQNAYNQLQGVYGSMSQLQAGGYGADVQSQAAYAQADPNAIAAQNYAQNFLQSASQGGLDAYADPGAIEAQWNTLAKLQDASNGALNGYSQAAQASSSQEIQNAQYAGMSRFNQIADGRLNVTSQGQYTFADPLAQANQESAAAALSGMANGKNDVNMWGLSGIFDLQSASRGGLDVDFANSQGGRDLYYASQGGLNQSVADIPGMQALYGVAAGSKDVNFEGLSGAQELLAASRGSKNVTAERTSVGQEDPAAYAAQQDALGKFKDLTTPEVTAQERFIYEQARLQQEQDERSNRAATMTNLRQRGLSGAGAEVGQAALSGQQTSQNRLLSDLGAQANAVSRSMQALQGYGGLSTAMSEQGDNIAALNANRALAAGQSNQAAQLNALGQYSGMQTDVAGDNANRQLAGLSQYSGISADVYNQNRARQLAALQQYTGLENANEQTNNARTLSAINQFTGLEAGLEVGNKDRRLQAQGMAYDAYGNLRQQSFAENAYRSDSLDAANQFNANLQFGGAQAAFNASSDIRGQEFSEAFNRGAAQDTMTTNNLNRQLNAMGMTMDAAGQIRQMSFNEQATNNALRLNAGVASGNLASTQRAQSFNEDFSTKTAADAMAQFNKEQSQISQRWQESYAAQQQDSAWGRATDVAGAGNQLANTQGANASSLFSGGNQVSQNYTTQQTGLANAGFTVNNSAFGNNMTALNSQRQLTNDWVNATNSANQTMIGVNGQGIATSGQQLADIRANTGMSVNNNNYNTGLQAGAIQTFAGANAADLAQIYAQSGVNNASSVAAQDDGNILEQLNRAFANFANS